MDNSTTADGPVGGGAGGPLPPVSADFEVIKSVYAWGISMLLVAATAVVARFYTRIVIVKALGVEDYCILIAFLFAIATCVGQIKQADFGLGHHVMELPPQIFMLQTRSAWVSILFYQLSLTFSKFSVCLLYIRIFKYHYTRIAAWCLLAIVAIYTIAGTINSFVVCIPLQAYWDFTITVKKCQTGFTGMWALVSLNVATDFLIFALPIPAVWRMNLPLRPKLGVIFIFALGFFVCLISVVRVIFIRKVTSVGVTDPSHDFINITNWTSAEICTAIVVPCLIVLKPLIVTIWPSFGRRSNSNDYDTDDNIVTIGGSGGNRSNSKVSGTARGGTNPGPFTPTASAAEKNSLCDIESSAGTSDGSGTPSSNSRGVGRVESAGSQHHLHPREHGH